MRPEGCTYIIDDDDPVRDSLAFLVRSAGLAVKTYADPVVFLDAAPSLPDGCIITDIRMRV